MDVTLEVSQGLMFLSVVCASLYSYYPDASHGLVWVLEMYMVLIGKVIA